MTKMSSRQTPRSTPRSTPRLTLRPSPRQDAPLGLIELFVSGSVMLLAAFELYRIRKELRQDREKAAARQAEVAATPVEKEVTGP